MLCCNCHLRCGPLMLTAGGWVGLVHLPKVGRRAQRDHPPAPVTHFRGKVWE